jgi:hypothetical protein
MSKMNDAELRRRLDLLASVQPSSEATSRAMDRVRQTILDNQNLPARKGLWRIIMESRWSKLAAAAVVVLAVVIGLNLTGSRHMGGVAWSQMLQNVRQSHSCIHRVFFTISRDNQPDVTYEFVMYRSSEYGIRRDAYREGKLVTQLYIPRDVNNCVEIVPDEKKYVKVKLAEQQLAEMREKIDPRQLAELIMSSRYADLEPKRVEGKTCSGIEVNDPNFGKYLFEKGVGRLWADVATDWPVLIELEGTSAGGAVRTRIVIDRFQWDPPLTPADFEPNIPADYTAIAEVDLSPGEQMLITAFRRFAKIAGGKYPSSLDIMTAMTEAQAAFLIERRKQGLSVEQQPTKEELSDLLAIQGACTFYGQLANEKKDVAYYGAKVTTEFPHAVLMRWRLDGDKYRVIFGDLTTREVTAEQLGECEAVPLNLELQVIKPTPADGTRGIATDGLQLKWLPGAAAVEHRLYFGSDSNRLPLLATVKEAAFSDLPPLERDTTYFWRVDEVNADGSVTPGTLLRFSTGRLVGWWKLDEGAGAIAADTCDAHHAGTLVGNPKWGQGAIDGALEFDGKGDYVDLGASADFDITDRVTVCAWIKVKAFTVDWQTIIAKGDTAWRLSRDQGNNLHFGCTGLWPEWVRGSANVNDGQWHHVAGVYDGAELRLYIDGRLDASARTQGSINIDTYPVWIGANAEKPGREWNGSIDDVRLYNYALSQDEIKALADRSTK